MENITCGTCAGNTVLTMTTYREIMDDDTVLVIRNVPCYKCTQCGEETFLFSTLDRIDEIKKMIGKKRVADYAA